MDRKSSIAEFEMLEKPLLAGTAPSQANPKEKKVGGGALREPERFFIKHDPESLFSGCVV